MEKENQNIDSFFKKKLDRDASPEGWNVPTDDIFEAAMNQVTELNKVNRNRKILAFLIIFFLIGSLSALGYYVLHNENTETDLKKPEISAIKTKIETLESEVEALKDAQKIQPMDIITPIEEISNTSVNSDRVSTNTLGNEVHASTQIDKKISTKNTITARKETIDTPNSASSVTIDSPYSSVTPELYGNGTSSSNSAMQAVTSTANNYSTLLSTYPLNSTTLLPLKSKEISFAQIIIPTIEGLPKSIESTNSNWSVIALFGINLSWMNMSNIPIGDMEVLKEYDQAHLCSSSQLSLINQLNSSWHITFDLGYSRYLNRSTANYNFFFQEDQISIDAQGAKRYETDLEMMNPIGSFETMIRFDVDDNMQQNELIKETLTTTQRLDYVSTGFTLNYSFLTSKKWKVYGGAGITLWQNVSMNNSFDVKLYMKDELKHESIETTNTLSNVNSRFISLNAQLGVGYDLNPSISLMMHTAYQHGVSSIRNSAPAPGPQTYLHAIQPMFGVRYKL